ncbi:MAG: hypothetical protein AAB277_04330 [Planctomycetota bacterium]
MKKESIYFDYRKVAKEIKVPDNVLREIEDEEEYPINLIKEANPE